MTPDPRLLDAVHAALDASAGLGPDEALPHLRAAADKLTELIDESMAEAVLSEGISIRAAGARVAERLAARIAGLEDGARGEVWPVDLVVRGSIAGAK